MEERAGELSWAGVPRYAELDYVYWTDLVGLLVWKNLVWLANFNRPVENGSVAGPLNSVVDYTLQIIKKMQREHIKSWVPKQDVTDAFNEHAQEWIKHTVWKDDCRSWYKSNETGRVNGMSSLFFSSLFPLLLFSSFNTLLT